MGKGASTHTFLYRDLVFYRCCSVQLLHPRREQPQAWGCRGELEELCSGCRLLPPTQSAGCRVESLWAAGTGRRDPRVLSPPGLKQHPQGKEVRCQHPPPPRSRPSPVCAPLCSLAKGSYQRKISLRFSASLRPRERGPLWTLELVQVAGTEV